MHAGRVVTLMGLTGRIGRHFEAYSRDVDGISRRENEEIYV